MSAALRQVPGVVQMRWGIPYDEFLREAWPMIRAHWAEVGSHRDILRLNPDHARYRAMQRTGVLHILTATVDGAIGGYLFVLIAPHPRDQGAIVARDDIFYVAPQHRRLRLGPSMIEAALAYIDGRADIVMFTEKLRRKLVTRRFAASAIDAALRHLCTGYLAYYGFTPQEQTWTKVLRRPHDGAA